ncbi:CACNA1B [Symbiodinium natans]|uniref:CACNA1B protein n=1 Tax=Symbiodinium natans TaxID=878477 RepID=A0A812N5N5_9DINO|nr:CACNA1B [Symbiodinium natans]
MHGVHNEVMSSSSCGLEHNKDRRSASQGGSKVPAASTAVRGDTAAAKRGPVRRRCSSGSERCRKQLSALNTEQSGAQKIRARIQTCLESRAGSGTCGRPLSRCRRAPRAAAAVVASTATSAGTTSRDEESSNVVADAEPRLNASHLGKAEVKHRSPSRSTSAGLSQRALTGTSAPTPELRPPPRAGPPPAAFAPPKRALQSLGAGTPPETATEAAASAAPTASPGVTAVGDSHQLLQVYRNIFEEVILRDGEYGATLRKVKGVYESYFLEVQRENARLRDFVATLQRALQGRGVAQAPIRWTAPSPDRDLATAWAQPEQHQVSASSPPRPFARPASVPRLDLQSLSPTRMA